MKGISFTNNAAILRTVFDTNGSLECAYWIHNAIYATSSYPSMEVNTIPGNTTDSSIPYRAFIYNSITRTGEFLDTPNGYEISNYGAAPTYTAWALSAPQWKAVAVSGTLTNSYPGPSNRRTPSMLTFLKQREYTVENGTLVVTPRNKPSEKQTAVLNIQDMQITFTMRDGSVTATISNTTSWRDIATVNITLAVGKTAASTKQYTTKVRVLNADNS